MKHLEVYKLKKPSYSNENASTISKRCQNTLSLIPINYRDSYFFQINDLSVKIVLHEE